MTGSAGTRLAALLESAHVVVCAGSGGVGKTTTAAALGVEAARRGRSVVVVTIDPAKRLADALGLEQLDNEAREVAGPWPGHLYATMLDARATFDALVREHAADAEQAERILRNRFYRNIAESLSGTQEYMASERLHQLHADPRFDLVVVDTPPTRNAIDVIEAPGVLHRFLDHRLFRALVVPGRGVARAVGATAGAFVRTVSRVVGAAVVDDAIEFFRAFEGMEGGFRSRAADVAALFSADETAFVLVTSPRRDTVEEAEWFARRLTESAITVRALVVNRMHPRPVPGSLDRIRGLAVDHAGTPLGAQSRALVELRAAADHERDHLAGLAERVRPAPVVMVPFLDDDVHDLDGLARVADLLVADG
ncbi:MAG TPA: ArsA-related P-loop ATPase [Acidimicrobiales bacterium]|nr:ArsA-related P-loop ATPase [Acidimicrobiales bacterium]